MIILGITGPTGAGKTTVSDNLRSRGIKVIDTDITARKIVMPGKPALKELCDFFGDILNDDKTLNRRRLAELAFSDPERTKMLNEITHKYITAEVMKETEEYDGDIIGIDGALLIESGLTKMCSTVIAVIADDKVRLERIMSRDSIDLNHARLRMNSQKNIQFYIDNSDCLVYNNGIEDIDSQLTEILKNLRSNV